MTEIDNIENNQLSNVKTSPDDGPSQMDLIFRSRFSSIMDPNFSLAIAEDYAKESESEGDDQ